MSEKIPVDQLSKLLRYDSETGDLYWIISNKKAGSNASNGYMQIKIMQKVYCFHRVAWAIYYGEWPEQELDHINRDKKDNRIHNLRLSTRNENNWNISPKKNNTSGFIGVYLHKKTGKWYSTIRTGVKRINLGYFDKIEDAVLARKEAAKKYHGIFAYLGDKL
jgi:hypothetical protein